MFVSETSSRLCVDHAAFIHTYVAIATYSRCIVTTYSINAEKLTIMLATTEYNINVIANCMVYVAMHKSQVL